MRLTFLELAHVRSCGLYVTDKCDRCGKLLNQPFRYTIADKPEVYCSAGCRELVFFRDWTEAAKHASPGKCAYCGARLEGKRRGALYCDEICRKRHVRREELLSPAERSLSRTPLKRNEQLARPQISA